MSFRGNGFSFDVLEKQKLLYMFLSNKSNVIEFYLKFNYVINNETSIEDLDKTFEVIGDPNGNLSYVEPIIKFSVRNKITSQVEDFALYDFHSNTYLPFQDEDYKSFPKEILIAKDEYEECEH